MVLLRGWNRFPNLRCMRVLYTCMHLCMVRYNKIIQE